METDSFSTKVTEMTNKLIEKIMMASGIIGLVWILAFLMVGMIDK